MTQKLVTIGLRGPVREHGQVQEHLLEYLADGWRIASICAAGGTDGVWVAALLEKGQPQAPPMAVNQPKVEYPHSDEGKPVVPSGIPVGPEMELGIGSRVLSFSQGRWWRAIVVGLEPGGLVKIRFPGWDPKWDTVVPRNELQVNPEPPPNDPLA